MICFDDQVVGLDVDEREHEVLPAAPLEHGDDGAVVGAPTREPRREDEAQQHVVEETLSCDTQQQALLDCTEVRDQGDPGKCQSSNQDRKKETVVRGP